MRAGVSRDQPSDSRAALGGVVGGVLGGGGRLAVALGFVYYVLNWGGPFFRQKEGATFAAVVFGFERWPVLALSACLGVVAGALGGSTCRPLFGAAIGGGLSGLFCVGLFVLPTGLAIGLSGGGVTDYSADQRAIAVGLLGMIVAGAFAGGAGALVGKLAARSAAPAVAAARPAR